MSSSEVGRTLGGTLSDFVVDLSLFFSSYAPLFLILAIRFDPLELRVVCYLASILGFAAAFLLLFRYRNVVGQEWHAKRVEEYGYEVSGYLATYLLPFVIVAQPTARDLGGYAIYLFVAGVVYLRSGMLQINPTLYLFGWRVMRVTIGDDWTGFAIAPRSLPTGQGLELRRVSERVFFGRGVGTGHDRAA